MATYVLTQNIRTGRLALVGPDGSFEFDAADGPLITSMFDAEWPECSSCEDRDCRPCEDCGEDGCIDCDCDCEGGSWDDEDEADTGEVTP
jgi:hypothetical protein